MAKRKVTNRKNCKKNIADGIVHIIASSTIQWLQLQIMQVMQSHGQVLEI